MLGRHGRPRDVNEVVNYVRAMNHGLARLSELPVSVRLIREIHGQLLEGVRGSELTPGEVRRSQNWIGPVGSKLNEASFVPPPPEEVPNILGEFERFLHEDSGLSLLIHIGLAHAQFETVHPFLDGNGRVGRLLITFLLCDRQVLAKPLLYLSHYFKGHRAEYYDRLQAVREAGEWEAWLAFFLRGVSEVGAQATETARRILALREDHRALIAGHLAAAAGNGHRVLEQLCEQPYVSVNDVKGITGTSYAAANDLVARLVGWGILQEVTGQKRHRRFRYGAYIDPFSELGPAVRQEKP